MIVMHGLLGASDNWLTLSRQWARNRRLFLLDLRNHGRSPHSEEHSYAAMSEDLYEFMNDHELRSAILLGHSMGGKVAMRFALDYPHKVERLIVADISPAGAQSPDFIRILEILRSLDVQALRSREEADARLAAEIPEPGLRAFLLKNLRRNPAGGYSWRVNLETLYQNRAQIAGNILQREGEKYEGPTLFLRGEKSPYIREEDIALIRKTFPRATFVTIPAAGHWIHADQPEAVFQAVEEFISSHEAHSGLSVQ